MTFVTPKPAIGFKQLHPDAQLPVYGSAEAAGADVRSVEELVLMPGERRLVPTGLGCSIPKGWEIQVRPRSGLAFKNGITVLNAPGTIDSDYTGEIAVILLNTGSHSFRIAVGDRIAQIVVAPCYQSVMGWVGVTRETERGAGGFGSTGVA